MIYVFKTSVSNKKVVKKLKPFLDELLKKAKWNFDLEDCDNILRIDSKKNIVVKVTYLLKIYNFDCVELE
ncbi:hypothetical protein SAMN05443292_3000 [Halpernia frigidisoli]|uniref:Uncharacterized protein n=1 Tax=Halpernia frigidisoli TaxID=1125876 RepID=A0A1I3JE98_9FLAO|nr:hypothetical protein SAMN05443292_3000 [Halpernia frigidisoli]